MPKDHETKAAEPIIEPQMIKLVLADRLVTIERCAQVADRFATYHTSSLACHPAIRHQLELVAAAIRKLKVEQLDPNIIYPGKDPDFTFPEE